MFAMFVKLTVSRSIFTNKVYITYGNINLRNNAIEVLRRN